MAKIKGFKAVRPTPNMAEKISALPYDVYNREEAKIIGDKNPDSFLHVDKAEIDFDNSVDQYDERVYIKANENLQKLITEKLLIQDNTDCMYVYTLTMNGIDHTGLVACTSVDDYLNGIIKKHELTRQDKENDRIKHIRSLNANTGPIFLTYKYNSDVHTIINKVKTSKPIYNFENGDGIHQKVWVIDDTSTQNELITLFEKIGNLYIADGHHRNAAAASIALEKKITEKSDTGEFNFYLSVMFPDNEVNILDYNRVVKDINGLEPEKLINLIEEKFDVTKSTDGKPLAKGEFGMYIDKIWYKLKIKDGYKSSDVIKSLDVSILQDEILDKILGIKDIRTDKRIDFVGGIRGIQELEKRVDSGEMTIAFSMFPTSVEELINVADSGKIMPPKSTWFEPKLKSGLFIHMLD